MLLKISLNRHIVKSLGLIIKLKEVFASLWLLGEWTLLAGGTAPPPRAGPKAACCACRKLWRNKVAAFRSQFQRILKVNYMEILV